MGDEPSELVDDRELQRLDQDRFRHRDVAEQLADLAATAETPANIALYGAWGSGKSGIANLLRDQFATGEGIVFTRFDAFKYSEVPLRRHFLSQLADGLLPSKRAKAVRERLYSSEKSTKVTFATPDVARAFIAFVVLVVIGFAIAALLAGLGALAADKLASPSNQTIGDRFFAYFTGVVAFSFAPAAVIGGLFAIAGKSMPIERTIEAPSTDEQFEREFKLLLDEALKEHKASRLVVFVDELDRCPAHRVVDVLDTVRTFLDVPNTVFIIAADQHVVEQALAQRVQQTTPSDLANPYYSTGSAYLDKIFHYQMSLPVLLPQRVTKYAVELVEGRPGLWSEDNIDVPWVVSVLIPTHVRSPRRVKTLLNNYVLAFRLARRRYEEKQLSSDPSDRALELAKLVCLRTEVPGFARELPLSRRLPELFLRAVEESTSETPEGVSEQVWQIAIALADGRIEVDEMLDGQGDAPSTRAGARGPATSDSASALRAQLHDYLIKTRHIDNPALDLIYLEGQGYLHGLDESLAQEVDDAALGGRSDELVALVDRQDPATQTRIVNLLSQRAHEAFPGIEGRNIVSALLVVAASRTDEVLDPCADNAFDALSSQTQVAQLGNDDLSGALRLGLRSDRAGARSLVAHVLAESAVLEDPNLGVTVLRSADQLHGDGHDLSEVVARWLLDDSTSITAMNALADQSEQRFALLSGAIPAIVMQLNEAIADDASVPTEEEVTAEGAPQIVDVVALMDALIARSMELDCKELAECLASAAFAADNETYWFGAGERLGELGSIERADLAEAVALRSSEVEPDSIGEWLGQIPEDLASDRVKVLMDSVSLSLWQQREALGSSYDSHDEGILDAMKQVARLGLASHGENMLPTVDSDLGAAPVDPATSAAAQAEWDRVRRFVDEGLIPKAAGADLICKRVGSTALAAQVVPSAPDEAFFAFVEDWCLWVAQRATSGLVETLSEQVNGSPFLPPLRRQGLCIRVVAMASPNQPPSAPPLYCPYDAHEVADLVREHLDGFAVAAAEWLRAFAADAGELYPIVEPFVRGGTYRQAGGGAIASAVTFVVARLSADERLSLASREIDSSASGQLLVAFLEDVRFPEANEGDAADLIIASYKVTATNNDRRRDLLDAWGQLPTPAKTTRTRLFDEVLLPMTEAGGKEALGHLLSRPELWRDPEGRKTAIKTAFRRVAGPNGDSARLERLLKEYDVVRTRKRGLLGRSEEIEED